MNLSFPRQVMLDRNLLFHEDWAVIGSEDVELGRRWTLAGLDLIYEPRAWGEHYHPHDLDSASRLQESIGRGLRDLEHLVQDPTMLESYGIFTWHNSPTGSSVAWCDAGCSTRRPSRSCDAGSTHVGSAAGWPTGCTRSCCCTSPTAGYAAQPQRRPAARPIVPATDRTARVDDQRVTVAA